MLLKRKSIESLMNVTKDSSAYAYVVQKAYEWNCDVTKTKRHANSLWLNWFYPKEYVDSLEYIEVK